MSSATHQRAEFDNSALSADDGEEAPEKTLRAPTLAAPAQRSDNVAPGLNEKIFPIAFDFTWESGAFVAQITKDPNSKDVSAIISANIGYLPFTAENTEMRTHALDFLRHHTGGISGKFSVNIAGRVTFTQRTRLSAPDSRAKIVSALTLCLLQARPYLKMVQSLLR